MNIKAATRKIASLGGQITKSVLQRYGVPEDQICRYFQRDPKKRAKKEKHLYRGPKIMFGHNTK